MIRVNNKYQARLKNSIIVFCAACCLLLLTDIAHAEPASKENGQQIFNGAKGLTAKIDGQDFDLPTEASRCINCHVSDQKPALLKKTQFFGPALNKDALLVEKSLRGGPIFSYTPTSFCQLLRTGIDPTMIVSKRSMPRYPIISNEDCDSLWAYIISIPTEIK